jgi:hypothetical protein
MAMTSGQQFVFRLLTPLMSLILLAMTALLHRCMSKLLLRLPSMAITYRHRWQQFIYTLTPYKRTLWTVLIFSSTQIALTSFSLLQCYPLNNDASLDNGSILVMSWPSIKCYDAQWYSLLPLAIIFLVIMVLIGPISMIFLLRSHYLHNHHIRHDGISSNSASSYDVLTEAYQSSASSWWEPFSLFRRATLAVVDVLFISPSLWSYRGYFFWIILFLYYQVHSHVQPFKLATENRAEGIGLIILMTLSMLLTTTHSPPYESYVNYYIAIAIIVPTITFTIAMIYRRVTKRVPNNNKNHDDNEDDGYMYAALNVPQSVVDEQRSISS